MSKFMPTRICKSSLDGGRLTGQSRILNALFLRVLRRPLASETLRSLQKCQLLSYTQSAEPESLRVGSRESAQ